GKVQLVHDVALAADDQVAVRGEGRAVDPAQGRDRLGLVQRELSIRVAEMHLHYVWRATVASEVQIARGDAPATAGCTAAGGSQQQEGCRDHRSAHDAKP